MQKSDRRCPNSRSNDLQLLFIFSIIDNCNLCLTGMFVIDKQKTRPRREYHKVEAEHTDY